MTPFGGYEMPVQYAGPDGGVLSEHRWTRTHAGLFDVSHMGQARLTGAAPQASFEKLTPGDFIGLKGGKQRYSLLLNEEGGILDDLMAGRPTGRDAGCSSSSTPRPRRRLRPGRTDRWAASAHLVAAAQPRAFWPAGSEADGGDRPLAPLAARNWASWRPLHPGFRRRCSCRSRARLPRADGFVHSIPAKRRSRLDHTAGNDDRVGRSAWERGYSLRWRRALPLYGHDVDDPPAREDAT
jgi:aminomethyltransferase